MRPTLINQRDSAQARRRDADNRVHVSLHHLLRLRHQATGYSFLPQQPLHSLLAGKHASRLRGRGLNFEELRRYLPGDDIRTIDWHVTARTRQPHVRVYTEERDRPMLLLVDQRSHMFFGSCDRMKSVVAAEVAALGAWRALAAGDRVGAVVFGDDDMLDVRPRGGRERVMQLLEGVVRFNSRLNTDLPPCATAPQQLNQALEHACRLAAHDTLIIIISDFLGTDARTRELTTRLAAHNDLLGVLVYDPLRRQPPTRGRGLISNGTDQIELDFSDPHLSTAIADDYRDEHLLMEQFLRKLSAPLIPLSTARDAAPQIRELLGESR